MDETMIDVVILLGVFFFVCKWLGQAVQGCPFTLTTLLVLGALEWLIASHL